MKQLIISLIFSIISFNVNCQTTLYTGGYVATTNSGGWVNSVIATIDITSYIDIAITVDFGEDGDLENQDSFDMQYQIDGSGPWSAFVSASNDICDGVCSGSSSGSVSGLNGTTSISIRTRLRNEEDETWWHDNLIVTGIPDPLPVELNYFIITLDNSNIIFNWETLSEINNDYFEIEKSSDGFVYEPIYKILGSGNSNIPIKYSISIEYTEESFYFRLKQVDFDGTTSYSETNYIKSNYIDKIIIGRFDINGNLVDNNYIGLIIIKYNDGTYIKTFQSSYIQKF